MTVVVGIDPGGRNTGIVRVNAGTLDGAWLLTRDHDESAAEYARLVVWRTRRAAVGDVQPGGITVRADVVAVEGINHPSPHMGITNVSGLLDTAVVFGALVEAFPDLVVVAPNRHGSGPLGCYPAELVGARERSGAGKRKHLRSAWDVAVTASHRGAEG